MRVIDKQDFHSVPTYLQYLLISAFRNLFDARSVKLLQHQSVRGGDFSPQFATFLGDKSIFQRQKTENIGHDISILHEWDWSGLTNTSKQQSFFFAVRTKKKQHKQKKTTQRSKQGGCRSHRSQRFLKTLSKIKKSRTMHFERADSVPAKNFVSPLTRANTAPRNAFVASRTAGNAGGVPAAARYHLNPPATVRPFVGPRQPIGQPAFGTAPPLPKSVQVQASMSMSVDSKTPSFFNCS